MSSRTAPTTRRRPVLAVVGGAAAAALAVAGCGSSSTTKAFPPTTGVRKVATNGTPTTAPPITAASGATATNGALALQQAFVAVVSKVRPQVVEISTANDLGSGVVYDNQGDIVTNDHVVGTATSFQVTFLNGQTSRATLVGAYPGDDLAVIKVSGAKNLDPATFGDSKSLQVGDITMAVGNPLGLSSSVTEGIVSFNGRTVQESSTVTLPSTIQTSASINPGNSGGALVDLAGEVIGIPTLAATDAQVGGAAAGIGFAIPSDVVKLIVPQLIATGKVANTGRAALGIEAGDGISNTGSASGVIVERATPGGGADKAGIKSGDVITAVNGQQVQSLADLQDVLASLTPGQTAKVTVLQQDGTTKIFTVTLGQLPSSS